MSNEYDDVITASLQPDPAQAARAGFSSAADTNPDAYAEARRVAQRTGVPVDTVFALPKEMKRQDAVGSVDFNTLAKTSPSTAALLADVDKAKMAHDDVDSMSGIESALYSFGKFEVNSARAIGSSVPAFNEGLWGVAQGGAELLSQYVTKPLTGTLLPADIGGQMAETFNRQRLISKAVKEAWMPKSSGILEAGWNSGLQSLGQNLLTMPAAVLTGNPSLALTPMVASTGGQAYGQARDKGLGVTESAIFGASQASIEYATEVLPVTWLLKDLKAGTGFGKTLTHQMASEIPGEQVATVLQDLNEWAVLNPDKSFKSYLAERPSAAAQTLIATVVGTGGQISVIKAVDMAMNAGQQKEQEAQQAGQMGELLTGLNKMAEASKLRERDTVTAQGFFQSVLDEGRDAVFITAEALAQSGLAEQMAQAIPAVQEQLETAAETGHDIRIPIADLMAAMPGPELEQAILPHVAVEPGGFTPTTAQEYLQSDHAKELQAEVERVLGEKEGDDTFKTSAEIVKTTVKDQLTEAGRFTESVNDAYSSMVGNFYAVQAARMGTTPEAMFAKYPLRIGAESIAGQQFDQSTDWKDDRFSYNGWTYFRPGAEVKQTAYPGQLAKVVGVRESRNGEDTLYKIEIDVRGHPEGVDENGDPVDKKYSTVRADELNRLNPSTDANDPNVLNQSAGPRMMAVHNLSADNLIFADKMGGLAVPSVGVVTEQAGSVDGFGEITLLGTKSLVDPAKERVFSSDAYTARFPKPEWPKAKTKDAQKLVNEIRETSHEFDDRSIIDYTWDSMTNTPDAGEVVSRWLQSNTIKALYLREQGVDANPVRKPIPQSTPVPAERLAELVPLVEAIDQTKGYDDTVASPAWAALSAAYKKTITEKYKGRGHGVTDTLTEFGYGTLAKLERDIKNAGKEQVDGWETSKQLGEQIDKRAVEFKQWVEAKVLPNFGEPFLTVGKKKAPYTLDNIVESMTGEKVRGKEKTMTYGPGQVRAAASIEFSDLEQMRKHAEGSVADKTEYEAAKEQAENELSAYRDAVVNFTKITNWKGEPDIWEAMDGSMRALAKWATGKKRDASALKAALRAEDFDVAKIPDEAIQQGIAAGNALMDTPVPYFEAKPQRSVGLDEFAGAIIPNNAPQAVRDILAKHNIEVTDYAGEENRNDVVKGFAAQLNEQGKGTLFQNQQAPRGSFNPATLQITLLKNADLSTFLHESGHFFLEVQADLAGQLQREASIHGADTLKPGEQQALKDMQATLDWFGIKDLNEWNNLDFEEKRSYHETFARGFESYLFEGTAPSIEMQGVFQRFRAWLLNVYKDLKALNVELTDEVRGVFDRMLATSEQIPLAEQGRSMMPLFTSPEQIGMTPDEFADYQALGVDSTNEAIEELQARGLRDMQWIHNARGRVIKQLQKESAAKRAEVQMEVRAQVMAQPIYRAWQFLTNTVTDDDKIAPIERAKSDPNVLDETLDSLFVAIAKLGGIKKDDVVSTWGVDPADKPTSGVFGKPLWRREGGLSIDGMAEALSQYGYLEKDEHGKWDIRELEEKFKAELGGDTQHSTAYDYAGQQDPGRPGDQVNNPGALGAGRLDRASLSEIGLPPEIIAHLDKLRMVKKDSLHPDLVAEMFGFTSGDELVRKLAAAETPKVEIEALTDVRMLERFGDLSSPEAIAKAADKAIHNEVRARMIATELNALNKATGKPKTLASAAKEYAAAMIARLKVRNIKPGQYASAEVRAAKASEKASKSGDLATAAAEKRNQLINNYATRAAYDAQDEVDKGLRYLKKFDSEGVRKGLDADYTDQIDALLERFDLRKGQSNKSIDKRTALAEWLTAQRDAGLEPDVPPALVNEAFRKSYKELTVEELRGLIDTVKQIEHLGRLKHRLLTARDQRAYEAVRDEIAGSIHLHAQGREADTRTPTTNMGRAVQGLKRFWAAHIKAATWARVMDGGNDGGPMWEYFIRSANEAGDRETTMRAEATGRLSEILAPVFKLGRMGGKGQFFPTINRSLNRESRIALALNVGNAGNLQRLLGGEGWTVAQITPVLQSLSAQEWATVQAVWDHFESYRPQIAAKERRVYGKEPEWVAATPFAVTTADGATVQMRGGYYPVKYDPAASQRAEEHNDAEAAKRQLQGAYTTATTRRSFTKSRVEEVNGRPLLYTLSGMYSGVNDVIHDLAWHEWLIDANRLLRSGTIDNAIRDHYGPETKQQFKTWVQDVAEGEKGTDAAVDQALARLRQGVSAAGLGFNVMSAAIQPLGITQSIVRVGAPYIGRGIAKYLANPLGAAREANEMSSFMENRARTRFRELNELRNQVQDETVFKQIIGRYAYFLMMRCQQMVDVPTWHGAYEKAIAEGNDEDLAINLADQAVIDSQGGGQTKDLSAIERGGPAQKLFTVFYSFMNTALNLGVGQTMAADTPTKRAKLAADYALLYVVPAILGYFLKAAITPGDSGDDDLEKIARKLAANQIDYLMGLMVVVREFSEAAKLVSGANDMGRSYSGPAGVRVVADMGTLATQVHQGEFDDAFRKSAINSIGGLFGLPSAQINRSITGTKALAEGKTDNPAAVVFGYQEKR